jgi:glycosyltransferase involved in cell wall biosynthesis
LPRCLIVFYPPDGGVAEHVMRLALGLRERGWDPWVLGPESAVIYPTLRRAEIPIARLPFHPGLGNLPQDARALGRLARVLRDDRFDVVNPHAAKAGVLVRLPVFGTRAPVVYSPHGWPFDPALPGPTVKRRLAYAFERVHGGRTKAIICVSEKERRIALDHGIARPDVLHTVYNGAPECNEAVELDPELEDFSREGPLAACLTVLRPGKGVEVFVAAAPYVLERMPGARLAIVGNGSLRDELQRQAASLRLDGRVRFFEYRAPSARQLRSLDVFVLSSPWEAFSIGALEAMACGVPQVVTDVGATSDAVIDGETGLLCSPNDPVSLAERIVQLLKDPELRARMSNASRERHRRHFTLERTLDQTAAIYDLAARSRDRT